MLRKIATAIVAVTAAGCSFVLDFSSKAIPLDAAIDAPFTADQCAFDEPDDTAATAVVVTSADTGPAAICPTTDGSDDLDFYKFTVPDMTATVTVSIAFTDALGDLDLRLFDATGTTMLAQSRGFGDGESITCPSASPFCSALAAGDYVFEVFPAVPGATNFYTFSVTITAM